MHQCLSDLITFFPAGSLFLDTAASIHYQPSQSIIIKKRRQIKPHKINLADSSQWFRFQLDLYRFEANIVHPVFVSSRQKYKPTYNKIEMLTNSYEAKANWKPEISTWYGEVITLLYTYRISNASKHLTMTTVIWALTKSTSPPVTN